MTVPLPSTQLTHSVPYPLQVAHILGKPKLSELASTRTASVARLLVECAPNHRDALLTALDQELERLAYFSHHNIELNPIFAAEIPTGKDSICLCNAEHAKTKSAAWVAQAVPKAYLCFGQAVNHVTHHGN